jgi:hypothetical protein
MCFFIEFPQIQVTVACCHDQGLSVNDKAFHWLEASRLDFHMLFCSCETAMSSQC